MALLVAANTAFYIVFSIFVVAFVGLFVYIAIWAIRRDREGRRQWLDEQTGSASGTDDTAR